LRNTEIGELHFPGADIAGRIGGAIDTNLVKCLAGTAAGARQKGLPASNAVLSENNACVNVSPPLSANGPSRGSMGLILSPT